ncbi:MAG: hypothetical protein A2V87_04430 [Deltaproteobacteria bacterium RBG_16_58_17]|nr:MAG: hypothetical protein A2V87_04430 [Deltaproteobacteria bacterium RBG_16_58_17]OHE18118.1 MAG: hypothetical protein A2X96_00290 [Syntrophobacterales bacterium GWC2_56_13]OHE21012.1 MAG: hypothetical protein A2X95_01130 [Syntrophobacterales bacterium GWF2_56_9]
MGLLKGSLTFSRYRIIGGLPDHSPDFFNERIRRYAFQTVWRTTDEKAAGLMDRLFQLFLGLRLSEKWGAEQARMQRWISPGSPG